MCILLKKKKPKSCLVIRIAPLVKACKKSKEEKQYLYEKSVQWEKKQTLVYNYIIYNYVIYDIINSHCNCSSPITKSQCSYFLKESKCDLVFAINLRTLFLFITQIFSVWSCASWKFFTKSHKIEKFSFVKQGLFFFFFSFNPLCIVPFFFSSCIKWSFHINGVFPKGYFNLC